MPKGGGYYIEGKKTAGDMMNELAAANRKKKSDKEETDAKNAHEFKKMRVKEALDFKYDKKRHNAGMTKQSAPNKRTDIYHHADPYSNSSSGGGREDIYTTPEGRKDPKDPSEKSGLSKFWEGTKKKVSDMFSGDENPKIKKPEPQKQMTLSKALNTQKPKQKFKAGDRETINGVDYIRGQDGSWRREKTK